VKPLVIKLGGRALEPPGAARELAEELRALARPVVLVHGGGAEVSAWCTRLGLIPRFSDGLRVTDPATLEVATAVLAGLANKRLVAALRARGLDAIGLSALDAGLARVVPHASAARLGEVGEVRSVDAAWLSQLAAEGRVPVISSIGADGERLLNLNADDLAAAIATSLGAPLWLLSDVEGVALEGRLAARLDARDAEAALRSPHVTGGMAPKLRAAIAATLAGVPEVWIARWSGPGTLAALLKGTATGTRMTAGIEETHHA